MRLPEGARGSVLIVCIWIVIILVLLALSIGRRVSFEARILRYHLDRSQAFYIAKSGLERIYLEKAKDEHKDYDSLSDSWSNKLKEDGSPEFKDYALGSGKFEIQYSYYESKDKEPRKLYGMQDEQSRININMIVTESSVNNDLSAEFVRLVSDVLDYDEQQAEELVDKFIDWVDYDDNKMEYGKDDYSDLAISAKNKPLNRLEELLMIEGFDLDIFNKLSNYLTIYGEGKININTAPKEILAALGLSKDHAQNIIDYRNGPDAQAATGDDVPIQDVVELQSKQAEIFKSGPLSSEDIATISGLITARITVTSDFYRVNSSAVVNNVKSKISAVVKIEADKSPQYEYWYEE
ncbi:MAG: type II secretion system protein GspK [Candidatus Omnitrophota bacterium]|nr:type II secretion system protein GspK [Candidatus Omnitrophota bacterium]